MINVKRNEAEGITEKQEKCYLPARFVLTFLMFWGMCLEFAHRVCLSVTIVVMVNQTAWNSPNTTSYEDNSCPNPLSLNETDPRQQGEYLWSPSTQGIILGAYFYGYVCTQMLGGRLSELAGGKWPLGISILIGSFLTLVTPIAADIGVVAIVLVRAAMGLLHGICLPTAFAMFAHWAPIEERSTLLSLCIIGDHVGTVLTMPLAGFLCDYGPGEGWPSVFYVLGGLGCVWFVFWACLAYNKPSDHPRISRKEKDYIQKGQIQMFYDQKLPVPWKQVLCSGPIWSVAIVTFCVAWGHTTLLTKLPTYLEVVLHVPIQKNGLINSLVYFVGCVTLFISGYLSDYLRHNKGYSPTNVRKGFQMIAMVGPALCTALIPVAGCQSGAAIALLTLAMTFQGMCGGGHVSISADMAPHHSATIFGLVNGLGCTAGIFSPLVAGFILDNAHSSITQWSGVFYLSAILYVIGGVVFQIFASADRQSWAQVPIQDFCKRPEHEKDPIFSRRDQDILEKSFKYGALYPES